jgi:vanillate O-demethylase ferredoxin subunit
VSALLPPPVSLEVLSTRALSAQVREIVLRAPGDTTLPACSAGAHVRFAVKLPDGRADTRPYSVVLLDADEVAASAGGTARRWRIAVRREDPGRGGSRFMHETLQAGDRLQADLPKNDFALQPHRGTAVLVAGGIGITPIASMAATRRAAGLPVRLVYAGRSRGQMAYLAELQALLGTDLQVHADDETAGRPLDVAALLQSCTANDHLYVCGPLPMLEAVRTGATAAGWPAARVHFELFNAPTGSAADAAFEVELRASGRTLTVPADRTILDVMIDAGLDPMFDCRRGECGVCAATVLEGVPDHRDQVLGTGDKVGGKVIQICVSRCRGARLVLDL